MIFFVQFKVFLVYLMLALFGSLECIKPTTGRIIYRQGSLSPVFNQTIREVQFNNQTDAINKLGTPDTVLDTNGSKLLIWYYSESYNNGFKNRLHRSVRIYILVDEHGKVMKTKIFTRPKLK